MMRGRLRRFQTLDFFHLGELWIFSQKKIGIFFPLLPIRWMPIRAKVQILIAKQLSCNFVGVRCVLWVKQAESSSLPMGIGALKVQDLILTLNSALKFWPF